jgi:hypothetical protein
MSDEMIEYPGCSRAGGANIPVYHTAPACKEPPPTVQQQQAQMLRDSDDRYNQLQLRATGMQTGFARHRHSVSGI